MMLPILDHRKPEFSTGLYQEHLTECGFLLSQRARYFEDSTIAWRDVADLENRLTSHMHGLETGGSLARTCAIEFLTSADQDQLLGAVYALATIGRDPATLKPLVDAFIAADDALLWCFTEGCKQGMHPELVGQLLPLLAHERVPVRLAIADILGYRRTVDSKRIWPLLKDVDVGVREMAAVACARSGNRSARAAVEQSAYTSDALPEPYVLPLLCLGSARALKDCREDCSRVETTSPVKLLALALAGSEQDLPLLLSSQMPEEFTPIVIKALGLQGHIQAIPHLLKALAHSDEAHQIGAAEALDLITAAGLRETVEIEEPANEIAPQDVLGAAPKENKSSEDSPAPIIRKVERICIDPARWSQWWQQQQKNFQSGVRFRHGKPFDLGVLVDALAHFETSYETRQLTYLELVIRSGQSIGFEPDWFIDSQEKAIQVWQQWWCTQQSSAANPWIFAGR